MSTILQSKMGAVAGGTSLAVTFDSAVAGGSQIVAFVAGGSSFDPTNAGTSISDGQGGLTRHEAQPAFGSDLSAVSDVSEWSRTRSTGGSVTVTLTPNVSSYMTMVIVEVSNPHSTPVNQTVGQTSTGTAITVNLPDTTVDDCIVMGALTNAGEGGVDTAAGTGYTLLQEDEGSTFVPIIVVYETTKGAAGAHDPAITLASSDAYGAVAIAIAPAPDDTVALTGTVTGTIDEADIVAGGDTIILTVTGDTVIPAAVPPSIAVRASVAWAVVTADSVITLPTHQAGDRIYVFAAWKPFGTTATISGWTEVTEFADGSVANGAGVGSVKVGAWYLDATSSSETNPTLDWSASPAPGARCAITLSKGATDSWETPTFASAAIAAATTWSATASSTIDVTDGAIVLEVAGFRDDSATMTRSATTALEDDGSPDVTWNGNVVEDPATHASSTTSNDISADLIYRFVTTGASGVSLTATGTLSASETGACLWVHQGATGFAFPDARAAIRDGLDSAQSEADGWDANAKPNIPLGNIVRTSDTVITITLQAQSDYDITAQETITATVPGSVLAGGSPLVATPTFTIDPAGGGGDVEGTLNVTLGAMTAAATATVDVVATFAVTLGLATLVGTGTTSVSATASPTLGAMTAVGTATASVSASATPTLGALTSTSTITSTVSAAASITLDAVTLESTGVVGSPPIEGTLAVTLADLSSTATATATVSASSSVTLGQTTLSSTATAGVSASAAITLGATTLAGTATSSISATGAVTLLPVTCTAEVTTSISASVEVTLDALTLFSTVMGGAPPPATADYCVQIPADDMTVQMLADDYTVVLPADDYTVVIPRL